MWLQVDRVRGLTETTREPSEVTQDKEHRTGGIADDEIRKMKGCELSIKKAKKEEFVG